MDRRTADIFSDRIIVAGICRNGIMNPFFMADGGVEDGNASRNRDRGAE